MQSYFCSQKEIFFRKTRVGLTRAQIWSQILLNCMCTVIFYFIFSTIIQLLLLLLIYPFGFLLELLPKFFLLRVIRCLLSRAMQIQITAKAETWRQNCSRAKRLQLSRDLSRGNNFTQTIQPSVKKFRYKML